MGPARPWESVGDAGSTSKAERDGEMRAQRGREDPARVKGMGCVLGPRMTSLPVAALCLTGDVGSGG